MFTVHSIPGSPFGRAVLAALEEKHADWTLAPVAPGSLRSDEHLTKHPFGRVPVLQHGDYWLYETQAILRYLDRVQPSPALTPTDPKAAGLMDQAMNVCDWYLFQGGGAVIGFQRVVGPMLLGSPPDEEAIAGVMPKAREVFAELSRLLGDKPYFAGEALSLADLMIAPHLDILKLAPEWAELGAPRPQLSAWLDRVTARPSFNATSWEALQARLAA